MINLSAPITLTTAAGLELGQPISEVLSKHEPIKTEDLSVTKKYSFGSVDLWVDRHGNIEQIGIIENYKGSTENGIKIGSSLSELRQTYKNMSIDPVIGIEVEGLKGICFNYDEGSNLIDGIYIFIDEDEEVIAEDFDWKESVLPSIKALVWSGFYSAKSITSTICNDVLEGIDFDKSWVKEKINSEFQLKKESERNWPKQTDYDRLDKVFKLLNNSGVLSIHNAGHTMSQGIEDVNEELTTKHVGFCFYHMQDIEGALKGGGINLAFGARTENEKESINVGLLICKKLDEVNIGYEWDKSSSQRIYLSSFNWQKRHTN